MDLELVFNILTLNIWGIPFISKDKEVRIRNLAVLLSKSDYDIISLQEVWSDNDYQFLKEALRSKYPHSYYFYSGVVGSGLCFFSKWPVIAAFFHAWSVNGYIHRIHHGDWFGGKGVGFVQINFQGHIVCVYLAHLHAEYSKSSDEYLTHRVIQAFDTAQFIYHTRGNSVLQVLAGDLNTEPNDIAYRILMSTSRLQDTYNLRTIQGTHEMPDNTYTSPQVAAANSHGVRIDYILYKPRSDYECEVYDYRIGFPLGKIPELDISYSDHEAVSSQLILKKISSTSTPTSCLIDDFCHASNKEELLKKNIQNLREGIDICNKSLHTLESHRRSYTIMAIGVIVILFNLAEISAPVGLKWPFLALKFFLCGLLIFFIIMASIWNAMERHGVLSGKLSMETEVQRLNLLK